MNNPSLRIIDAHTHVQFPEFDHDRQEVISRAHGQGIGMINVGTDLSSSQAAVALAQEYETGVWATIGAHPHEISQNFDREAFERLAQNPRVVGIGECGLDYFRMEGDKDRIIEKQKELFSQQIELAIRSKKPLVIHCRPSDTASSDAFEDVIAMLEERKNDLPQERGICHFFTGTVPSAQRFLELGFSFTFGGLITFNREFDEVLRYIPERNILVETDAPFVAPKPYRGKRNEPAYVAETVRFLSEFKGVDPGIFLENTRRVFGI